MQGADGAQIWTEGLCGGPGDSACSLPPQTISEECLDTVREWTPRLAKALNVVGLINIQYCVQDNQVGSRVSFDHQHPGYLTSLCLSDFCNVYLLSTLLGSAMGTPLSSLLSRSASLTTKRVICQPRDCRTDGHVWSGASGCR